MSPPGSPLPPPGGPLAQRGKRRCCMAEVLEKAVPMQKNSVLLTSSPMSLVTNNLNPCFRLSLRAQLARTKS